MSLAEKVKKVISSKSSGDVGEATQKEFEAILKSLAGFFQKLKIGEFRAYPMIGREVQWMRLLARRIGLFLQNNSETENADEGGKDDGQ